MTGRTEILTDGSCDTVAGKGGWAAVIVRTASGRQASVSSYEMELRALIEAAKLADGPSTLISDHQGIIRCAQQGETPKAHPALWQELYAAIAGKAVQFDWRRRDQTLGQQIAHQLARAAVRGR